MARGEVVIRTEPRFRRKTREQIVRWVIHTATKRVVLDIDGAGRLVVYSYYPAPRKKPRRPKTARP